jgi:hypothetical protein
MHPLVSARCPYGFGCITPAGFTWFCRCADICGALVPPAIHSEGAQPGLHRGVLGGVVGSGIMSAAVGTMRRGFLTRKKQGK